MQLYTRRRLSNYVVVALSLGATAFGLLFLAFVLGTLLKYGVGALNLTLFTQTTPPPGSSGGLINAIFGSLVMTVIATLVGTPTGILAGTFLAEYAHNSRLGEVVRFINDILLSAPSIIIGLFVYTILVVPMGHFSAWAGAVALAIIMIPVIVRTTEDMLSLVPTTLREAAAALGAPKWKIVMGRCPTQPCTCLKLPRCGWSANASASRKSIASVPSCKFDLQRTRALIRSISCGW